MCTMGCKEHASISKSARLGISTVSMVRPSPVQCTYVYHNTIVTLWSILHTCYVISALYTLVYLNLNLISSLSYQCSLT